MPAEIMIIIVTNTLLSLVDSETILFHILFIIIMSYTNETLYSVGKRLGKTEQKYGSGQ